MYFGWIVGSREGRMNERLHVWRMYVWHGVEPTARHACAAHCGHDELEWNNGVMCIK